MVSVGGINLAQAILDAELRILVLEQLVQQLIINQSTHGVPLNIDMSALRDSALSTIQKKYPQAGITKAGQ